MAKRDYEPVFSGKHDNSVLGVANKDYDAAAIANEVMFRMFERKVVGQGEDPDRSTSPRRSRPPATASRTISIRRSQAKIKEAFFTFPWEGSALQGGV